MTGLPRDDPGRTQLITDAAGDTGLLADELATVAVVAGERWGLATVDQAV